MPELNRGTKDFTPEQMNVLAILATTDFDFRSAQSLSDMLDVTEAETSAILESLRPHVRRPIGMTEDETNHWRLTTRGRTRGEQVRRVSGLVGRYSVDVNN